MTSLRAIEILHALNWLAMARESALRSSDVHTAQTVVERIDIAIKRIHSALDIKPSEAAIEEVVEAQKVAA